MAKNPSAATTPLVADPPRPHKVLLGISFALWCAWLGFLIWLAWRLS